MGSDKAMLAFDGVPMARLVADSLIAAGCTPVVAIGGDAAALRAIGITFVDDDFPGEGPLGGIVTALAIDLPALVLACDVPAVRSSTLMALIDALGQHDAAMAVSDRAEPLCALWSASAAPVLRARFDAGERAMHRAIDGLDIAWVNVPKTELRNINTPGDLGAP